MTPQRKCGIEKRRQSEPAVFAITNKQVVTDDALENPRTLLRYPETPCAGRQQEREIIAMFSFGREPGSITLSSNRAHLPP